MTRDYMKVKRGMVFSYNINPEVDKFNVPKIVLNNGKEIDDSRQYGYRDFLVISNDTNNSFSPTCNIIPITTSTTKSDIPTHVKFNYFGKELTVLCEQIYTIHVQELYKYEYTLSDEILSKVEDALAVQLNMNRSRYDAGINASLDQIESIIQGIINKKVEEANRNRKANAIDVEDAVLRLGEGLMTLLGDDNTPTKKNNIKVEEAPLTTNLKVEDTIVSTPITIAHSDSNKNNTVIKPAAIKSSKPQSQVDKFYNRYPNLNKDKPQSSDKPTRRKWTKESMQEFMDDANRFSPTDMVKKYNFKDTNDYYKTRYYVQNRLAGRL